MQIFFVNFLDWAKTNNLASTWSDVFGLLIAIVGFTATLYGVFRSKRAALLAQEAAQSARDSIRLFDAITNFSTAISILEEIRRTHRQNDPAGLAALPDRYASIRKHLILLRASPMALDDDQHAAIQNALVNLADIEKRVEKALAAKNPINPARINGIISADIDNLLTVLTNLKVDQGALQ
jgi:hypothetical protein